MVAVGTDAFVLADIPGLMEGAHSGAGLGTRFLGHIERCRVLIHLVDATSDDVVRDYRTIRNELAEYGHGLAEKPEIVVLTKIDALPESECNAKRRELATVAGQRPMTLSAIAGAGVTELLRATRKAIDEHREEIVPVAEEAWQP
jgi:GTP-binding protein